MAAAEWLKPHHFLPGQSGNPGGRPKKSPVTTVVIKQLGLPIPAVMYEKLPPLFKEIYGGEATFADMLAFQMIAASAQGDISALKELLERVEGKVAQKMELEGDLTTHVICNL